MNLSEKQQFFVNRIIEIFHKDSVDSYRVKYHNAYTLLLECQEVLNYWQNGNVNIFDTIELCLDETYKSLQKDTFISYNCCSKRIFLNEILEYKKSKGSRENSRHFEFFLDEVVSENKDLYFNKIIEKLKDTLVKSPSIISKNKIAEFEELDQVIGAFASQLVHLGFSKIFLFQTFLKNFQKSDDNFDDAFDKVVSLLTDGNLVKRTVIFRIYVIQKNNWVCPELGLQEEIPMDILNDYIKEKNKSFIEPSQNNYFYIFEAEKSHDSISAIKLARQDLSNKLDMLHLGNNLLNIELPNKGLIIYKDNQDLRFDNKTEYILDGYYGNEDQSNTIQIKEQIEKTITNIYVKEDVKERLTSALRHLRIGNTQKELEQRFINYWIALEFLFASPKAEAHTFSRLKSNIVNILLAGYMKRNLFDINKQLINNEIISINESIENQNVLEKAKEHPNLCSLLEYRLSKWTSLLNGNKDKRKDYFSSHKTNVTQHIARIYRLRNELIHEAAIKQDIESITSNLRYYLVFVINQMIEYFSKIDNGEQEMDDFFYKYDMLVKKIEESYDLDVILKVPLPSIIVV